MKIKKNIKIIPFLLLTYEEAASLEALTICGTLMGFCFAEGVKIHKYHQHYRHYNAKMVYGCWWLVAGCWLLVAGCWMLAFTVLNETNILKISQFPWKCSSFSCIWAGCLIKSFPFKGIILFFFFFCEQQIAFFSRWKSLLCMKCMVYYELFTSMLPFRRGFFF